MMAVPHTFNIGTDVVFRQDARQLALLEVDARGNSRPFTFGEVSKLASRLANVLLAHGLSRGERVAVLLSQRHETAVAHVAVYISGLIAVPLFTLFGEEALEFRLHDCGARVVITDREGAAKLESIKDRLPALRAVFCVDGDTGGAIDFHIALTRASDHFEPVRTLAEDPALIIYTSGTTGNPKGTLHAHRVLLGHLPGVEYPHDGFPQPGDRFWTPADWAWIGGLLDVLLPAWHHGVPVVAHRAAKFDPEATLHFMARWQVRNVFLPPTSLRLLRQSGARHAALQLRSLASGGESLGADVLEWGRSAFALTINEFYGQTECNLVVGNGKGLPAHRPGWTGTPIPGHAVRIVNGKGEEVPHGTPGNIAVRRPDAEVFVLGQDNLGVNGLAVKVAGVPATSCGAGCYRASLSSAGPVSVSVAGRVLVFQVPAKARPAAALVARATSAFRRLRSVDYLERLASSPQNKVIAAFTLERPNRLEYRIRGGADGIIIGARRWDRARGGKWVPSPQEVTPQPEPIWAGHSTNAYVLDATPTTYVVSFFKSTGPVWFTLRLDRKTLLPRSLRMTAAAHFMTHRYTGFNEARKIRAPSP